MKEVNHVYETNDYSMFKTLDGNRDVQKLHVQRLKKSFSEEYLFSPLIVNEKNEVIDGSHRLQAASELNLPIRFIICEKYGLKEIHRLNTNMKNWKKEDYLEGYCDLKYPEYLKFRNFMRRFPEFGIGSAEIILTQRLFDNKDYQLNYRSKSGAPPLARIFEEGNLSIPDYEKSVEIAETLLLFKSVFDKFCERLFVMTIMGLMKKPQFSISELLAKLKTNPNTLQPCRTITSYRLLIEDIYNYRRREKINLRY
jgi:hypothetical protein